MNEMHQRLLDYETDFLRASFCQNETLMDERIHPDFLEIGSGGIYYDKPAIIRLLLGIPEDRPIEILDFSLREMGPGLMMVLYQTYHQVTKEKTARMSLWSENDQGWQLLYHQATPISVQR